MPFGPVFSPSIGLSLLQAGLADHGVRASIRYFTIPFAERVGLTCYSGIAQGKRPPLQMLAGEWIFAHAAFPEIDRDDETYVDQILNRQGDWARTRFPKSLSASLIERLRAARRNAETFLAWCTEEILNDRPRIVGFTSVFQQHLASLALARRLKAARPDVTILFGGANCEGIMGAETVRQCRFVDAAVSGEADAIVPQLVQRILAAEPLDGLPGVRTHANVGLNVDEGRFGAAPMVSPLDALPYPDYEDYFRAFRESRFDRHWYPRLFFETSRGCWWGERMHCTFCGLNGGTMTFRSKSPRRAIDELVTLTSRYPESDVQVVDNILDLRYFDSVLPELAARKLNISLYYETKANLKRPQVALLRQSGITQIQPGIESLSDAVLKLMRKGVTALQNIQLLKWCREFGVDARWNFLWGFPGEPEDEYRRMADWIPLLTHLQPPVGMSPVRLDRFSPNFFDRDRLGFADVRPLPSYRHLYPFDESAVANLAYYFSYGYRVQQDVVAYARPLARALRRWKLVASRSELFAVETDAGLVVCDRRPVRRQSVTVLRGPERTLYRLCDAVSDLSQLQDRVGRDGVLLDSRGLTQHLDRFVSNGLMIRDGSRYLALALSTPPRNVRAAGAQVPLGQYRPSRAGMKLVHRQPVSSTEGRS